MPEFFNPEAASEHDPKEWSEPTEGVFIHAKSAGEIMQDRIIAEFEADFVADGTAEA